MSERLLVVSTDCHAGLPISQYKPYVETKYHDFIDMAVDVQVDMMDKAEAQFLIKEINDAWRAPIKEALTGAWDYKQRSKMLAVRCRPRPIAQRCCARTAMGGRYGPQPLALRTRGQ